MIPKLNPYLLIFASQLENQKEQIFNSSGASVKSMMFPQVGARFFLGQACQPALGKVGKQIFFDQADIMQRTGVAWKPLGAA